MRPFSLLVCYLLTPALWLPSQLASAQFDPEVLYQAYVGALDLDNQGASWPALAGGSADAEFSTAPIVGIESEFVFQKGWVHWGINSGGSVAWKDGGVQFSSSGGTTPAVAVDSSLLLGELHVGGYIRGRLHDRITTYAAAGPMLLAGYHDIDDETVFDAAGDAIEGASTLDEGDSTGFNIGYYARAGIDFEIRKNEHLGVGFRYISSDLDLDDTVGNLDIEGTQLMLTFSKKM